MPPSTGKVAEKEQKLFESAHRRASFFDPGNFEERRVYAAGGQQCGLTTWRVTQGAVSFAASLLIRFLWASKENEH